jgi:hypothetical protein
MLDLYLAILLTFLFSSLLATLSLLLARHLSRPIATITVIFFLSLLFLYAFKLHDDLRLARLLPFSSVMVLGNPAPELVALIVGFAWRIVPGPKLRRALILMPLVGACLYNAYSPVFVDTPVLGNRWDFGLCRQTSKESCSPAAAATLLHAHNIPASEQEMASLCLTSSRGTTMLGLYRSLKLKTQNTPWTVEIFHGTLSEMRGLGGPILITVGIKKDQPESAHYREEWGLPPGMKHTVVLLDFPGTQAHIADPAAGHEQWSLPDLQRLWYGQGLRLIPRK